MPFNIVDRTSPMVGSTLIKGYEVLANYRNQYVLAKSDNAQNPEPYVVWNLDRDGDPNTGSYRTTLEAATKAFCERCYPSAVEIDPASVSSYGATKEQVIQAFKEVRAAENRLRQKRQKVPRYGVKYQGQWHMSLELIMWYGAIVEIDNEGLVTHGNTVICQL